MKRLSILSLIVFIFFVGCATKKQIVVPPLLQERLERLQKENEALINEKKEWQEKEETLRRKNKGLEAKIVDLEKENEDLVKDIEENRVKSEKALQRLKEENERIKNDLERYIKEGKVEIKEEKRGLKITLIDKVLFDTGQAIIKEDGVQILNKVAEIIKRHEDREVVIEGHTDSVPICNWKYPSNWELSTRRATEVLKFFINKHGISPLRLQATGYGEYRPIATNETEEGRKKNRRVEIILLPADYLREVTTLQ
ncbi:MAG: OmpA family protein [bacterium]|nr:OmpA family protein [bacterium]